MSVPVMKLAPSEHRNVAACLDAHNVGVTGDVYALGQLIAWALGVDSVPNLSPTVPMLWQEIVDLMTQQDARRRPQTMADVRRLLSAMAIRVTL
jgi:hypothetical protein